MLTAKLIEAGHLGLASAAQYLRWFARLYGREPTREDLGERLARVGLDARDARPVGAYSRGMKQRLGLAHARRRRAEGARAQRPGARLAARRDSRRRRIAGERGSTRVATSPFVDFHVERKPVVESQRILPVAKRALHGGVLAACSA